MKNDAEKQIAVATTAGRTRPMKKSDYTTIYALIEAGTPREAILVAYPIKLRTLNLRIAEDRPDLWEQLKSLPSSKRVEADDAARADSIIKAAARVLKVDLTEVVGHDIGVLAADVRQQKAEKLKDPHKVLKPVGLHHARNILALAKAASLVPGVGMESGGAGVTINNNVGTHAQVMRRDGDDIFASDDDILEAVVIEQRTE